MTKKILLAIKISQSAYDTIESRRGDASRGTFIEEILMSYFNNPADHEVNADEVQGLQTKTVKSLGEGNTLQSTTRT